ncbi:MAG TPA: hypothetical protein VLA66_12310 [Thermoanaerobaculia bacterium]|nr:hypothetical protein [Thermoanaerobaculia bacterium]
MGSKHLVALAPPLALAAAGVASALLSTDRVGRTSTVFLVLVAAALLSVLAATAPAGSRIVPGAAVAAFVALAWLPRATPLPAATLALLLAAALVLSMAERIGSRARPVELPGLLGLALAAQGAARIDAIFLAPTAPRTWLGLLAPALLAALALRMAARRRPASALALGLATFAAGPGWGLLGSCGLVVGAAALVAQPRGRAGSIAALAVTTGAAALPLAFAGPAWLALAVAALVATSGAASAAVRRAGLAALTGAAALALVAGSLPWRQQRPLATVLGSALRPPFRTLATPVAERTVVLDQLHPVAEIPIEASGARAVEVVSYLTNATALPCATPVARIVLERDGSARASVRLEAGRDTAEWAAARADVAAALGCPAPAPHWSWIPATGRFLGSTYRSRALLPAAVVADRVRLERDPALPPGTAIAFFWVGVER